MLPSCHFPYSHEDKARRLTLSMGFCSICLEDTAAVVFMCPTVSCQYEICEPCVKDAFADATGDNFRNCPSCKAPTAQQMIESMCGKGAVLEVERQLRSKVEFEVKKENLKRERGKEAMGEMKQKSLALFRDLSERLNMQCPRCSIVFDEYDGCNALRCWNSSCKAAICAICLQDCGQDAHAHVLSSHGNLFDKELFYREKKKREVAKVDEFMRELDEEPFEVRELVRIEYEKSVPGQSASAGSKIGMRRFLQSASHGLKTAVRADRLSVLNDSEERRHIHVGFAVEDVSPRNTIPEDYRLVLVSEGYSSTVCRIQLLQLQGGRWKEIPLPDEETGLEREADGPKVDALINVRRSLQCGVIAFSGERQLYQSRNVPVSDKKLRLENDEVSIMLRPVNREGSLSGEEETLSQVGCSGREIVGVNQNLRLLLLERHVDNADEHELQFGALRNFVGDGAPKRVFREIPMPAPDTFMELNRQQQRVAHPLSLTTAMEVAGPPGTGKTKTITELVRAILECTDHDVIVLSERNGAIDAIADKIAGDCVERDSGRGVKKVNDVKLWTSVVSFGSAGSMGPSTKVFTPNEKLRHHPELQELRRIVDERKKLLDRLAKDMLFTLSDRLEELEEFLPEGADVWKKSQLIKSSREPGLMTATETIATISYTEKGVAALLQLKSNVLDQEIDKLVADHSAILEMLVPTQSHRTGSSLSRSAWRKQSIHALERIDKCLSSLLKDELFSVKVAEQKQADWRKSQDSLSAAEERILEELTKDARIFMCTIGSSHRLPVEEEEQEGGLVAGLARLSIGSSSKRKKTIVVFDEAGCIPSYELLGISRLQRDIEALVCVGDEHQLPPYSPTASKTFGRRTNGAAFRGKEESKTESLLDASALRMDDGKVKLTTQYRVPRDIANLLNARIYRGEYNTADQCNAPMIGFNFIDIREDLRDGKKKYVNRNEIEECIELVYTSLSRGIDSIMVLTPYKKQQRELEFRFKREGLDDVPVLTIDQCQGQEADVIIISLVQKPTRFLNKNRMNVALSRVRQKLYFVADKARFSEASSNSRWDCWRLAKDLLEMSGDKVNSY